MAAVYRCIPAVLLPSGTLAGQMPRPHALFSAPALRSLRLAQLLSQEVLAVKANVARSAITNLEDGGVARASTIHKLATALGCTPADLMRPPLAE